MTREEAIEALSVLKIYDAQWLREAVDMAIEALSERPTDEWCTDCKEYDHEKHCCPRFNRVIRTTLNEVVYCKDCRHAGECHKSVQYTRNEPNTVTIGYTKIDFCSHGERRE